MRQTCARDSSWCDGVICRERGIDCPNADPVADPYDELVEFERTHKSGDDWRPYLALHERLMWEEAKTPEEVLAAQMIEGAACSCVKGGTRFPNRTIPTEHEFYARCKWPWGNLQSGDKGSFMEVGGRTRDEARLLLRDALVESAREAAKT